ncbi:MAG: right-handed parallel beta-helix repeat-containing protein [Bacteroidales bacterium]|nr:right-handed parallel beta-helix repeat-containing protein [Bacteroidales bacterium]
MIVSKRVQLSFCLLLVNILAFADMSRDSVFVTDFGIVPGSRQNATPAVIRAMEACKGKENALLIFPTGRYDFWPAEGHEKVYFESNTTVNNPRRLAILIEKMHGLTLEGMNSEFVFHDRIQPLTIDHSSGITVRNFSIDWDIPLTAQGEVIAINDSCIELQINILESPFAIENGKLVFIGEGWKSEWNGAMEFERESRLIAPETGDYSCLGDSWANYVAKDLGNGKVRLVNEFKRKPALGNSLVLRHSLRDHAGIFICNSKDVKLEGVNVYHTAGLGILSQYTENISFNKVKVVPNPAKNRYLSGHDDGLHFSNCKGSIIVDNCEFAGLMDDPINVHGTSVRIMEILPGNKVLCKFMHHQSVGMEWAFAEDEIGFIENESMQTLATGRVQSFTRISDETFELQFSKPLPKGITAGDALENLSWTASVTIKNSRFRSCRARGILISTPGKVLIEDNNFESSGSAILIAGDANYWYESGAVKDVLIRNNKFMDPCLSSMYQFSEAIISICPEIPSASSGKYFHRNIRIEENEFHPFDYPILYAKSVQGLSFTGNTLERSKRFKPFHYRKSGITLEYCSKVRVKGNKAIGDVLGRKIELINTTQNELQLKGESFFTLMK